MLDEILTPELIAELQAAGALILMALLGLCVRLVFRKIGEWSRVHLDERQQRILAFAVARAAPGVEEWARNVAKQHGITLLGADKALQGVQLARDLAPDGLARWTDAQIRVALEAEVYERRQSSAPPPQKPPQGLPPLPRKLR